jgi:heptosyltransferase III
MPSAAVIPAIGIGDALLMMIASEQLRRQGYQVTTFHSALPELTSWFPGHTLRPFSAEELACFDLILVENDNSPRVRQLVSQFRERLSIFYPSYRSGKHAPLSPMDQVFNPHIPMADNVAQAIANLLKLPSCCKDNGLIPPVTPRPKQRHILIHPTSRVSSKNWKTRGFVEVARGLLKRNLKPLFCGGPTERKEWSWVEKLGFPLAETPSLCDLATLIYESSVLIGNDSLSGHLASNLGIPTLIIANDAERMRLWRPGWRQGELVLPPSYLPNWRWLRLKENHWQRFISAKRVLQKFTELQKDLSY